MDHQSADEKHLPTQQLRSKARARFRSVVAVALAVSLTACTGNTWRDRLAGADCHESWEILWEGFKNNETDASVGISAIMWWPQLRPPHVASDSNVHVRDWLFFLMHTDRLSTEMAEQIPELRRDFIESLNSFHGIAQPILDCLDRDETITQCRLLAEERGIIPTRDRLIREIDWSMSQGEVATCAPDPHADFDEVQEVPPPVQ